MKKLFGAFFLLLLVGLMGVLTKDGSPTMESLKKLMHNATVTVKNTTFNVTVVKTQADREKGLSGKTSLATNDGMLFIFDKPDYYNFWMKDMKFPIDIIFIHNNTIVTIYQNAQPPAKGEVSFPIFKPSEPVDEALEINANQTTKYHIQVGDAVETAL